MPTCEERNKATVRRFQTALEGDDPALTERTIDEVVSSEALLHTPLPIDTSGASSWASPRPAGP